MLKTDGGDLVARSLRQEGARHIFALSGDNIQAIFDACLDEDIRIIDTRHEQAAVHMADGWARVTGEPGVAVVTAGPGVVDAVPGMATAYQAASPVVLVAGRVPFRDFESGFGFDFDQVGLMRPVTKWAATCYEAARLPEYINSAFRHARSGRPGPVFLDIPTGVMENPVEGEVTAFPPSASATARSVADLSQLKIAVDMLSRAERPLAIAGSGVWWSGAGEALRRFIETTQVPLLLSMMGRGAVPEDHPLCFGPLRVGCREADVILVVGARLNNWLGKGRPPLFGTGQRWIQVDIEAEEIGHNRPIDLALVGDAREVLQEMTRLAQGKPWGRNPSWLEELRKQARERRERMQGELTSDKVPIHPLRLCQEIQSFVARDATLITDGGDIAVFGNIALRVFEPGHWMDQANLGLLGSGIPFGLAAKLARPDKQVLVLIGDGSFGLNGMEMDTAVRHHLPIVVVVGNDAAWGMIKHRQEIIYGPKRVVGTELRLTHYEEVVRALGGYGEYVERPQDIRPALERAFASGLPACVNVATDPTVVSPLTRRTATVRG